MCSIFYSPSLSYKPQGQIIYTNSSKFDLRQQTLSSSPSPDDDDGDDVRKSITLGSAVSGPRWRERSGQWRLMVSSERTAYESVFHNADLTLSQLKDAAIDGHLHSALSGKPPSQSLASGLEVPGRSIAWKVRESFRLASRCKATENTRVVLSTRSS